MSVVSKLPKFMVLSGLMVWDAFLTVLNFVTPNKRVGTLVPEGHPGFGGKWPKYIPPAEGDSRCSCPALNAMANHGLIPHDGRNISFSELNRVIHTTFNFAPTFCFFVPYFAAGMLEKNYWKDTVDLHELDLHSKDAIEHDASLTREDAALQPDQSKPSLPLVHGLLKYATGTLKSKDSKESERILTPADLSRYSAKRRVDSRRANKAYEMSFFHKMFGSSNSSTLLTIFGGRVSDLTPLLAEERLPDGWESKIRSRNGLTIGKFNGTVLKVEFGINEKQAEKEEAATNQAA